MRGDHDMKTTTLFIGLTLAVAGTANGQCIQGDIDGDGAGNGIDLAYVLQNC